MVQGHPGWLPLVARQKFRPTMPFRVEAFAAALHWRILFVLKNIRSRKLKMKTARERKYQWSVHRVLIGIAVLLAASISFADALPEIDVTSAAAQIREKQVKVLDVREPAEFATGVIQGAVLIPLGQVEKRLAELDGFKNQPMYVVCGSGGRSAQAIKVLSKNGFTQLTNIKGGMNAWRKAKLPVVAP